MDGCELKCFEDDYEALYKKEIRSVADFFEIDLLRSRLGDNLPLRKLLKSFPFPKIKKDTEYLIYPDRFKKKINDLDPKPFFEKLAEMDSVFADQKLIFRHSARKDSFDSLLILRSDGNQLPLVIFLDHRSREKTHANTKGSFNYKHYQNITAAISKLFKKFGDCGSLNDSSSIIQALTTGN
jgi:hypothetical protein